MDRRVLFHVKRTTIASVFHVKRSSRHKDCSVNVPRETLQSHGHKGAFLTFHVKHLASDFRLC